MSPMSLIDLNGIIKLAGGSNAPFETSGFMIFAEKNVQLGSGLRNQVPS